MTPERSCKRISLTDFSEGVIVPMIVPRPSSEATLREAIAEQANRFASINGVVGLEVDATFVVEPSSSKQVQLEVVKATRDYLNSEQLLVVQLGALSRDLIEATATCKEFGADAILACLDSRVLTRSGPSTKDVIAAQAQLVDQSCLPVLLDQPYAESNRAKKAHMLQDAVAKHSENTVGIVMRHDDRTCAYDEGYYALKALDRPIACLTGSDTALFHNLNTGADGVISKLASIAPHEVVALFRASRDGRFFDAQATHNRLSPVVELVGNRPPKDRDLIFRAIANKRGLLGSADRDDVMTKLDASTLRRIDKTLEAVALTPID